MRSPLAPNFLSTALLQPPIRRNNGDWALRDKEKAPLFASSLSIVLRDTRHQTVHRLDTYKKNNWLSHFQCHLFHFPVFIHVTYTRQNRSNSFIALLHFHYQQPPPPSFLYHKVPPSLSPMHKISLPATLINVLS